MFIFFFTIFIILLNPSFLFAKKKLCIYVNSYHKGYIWSDSISIEIYKNLKSECKVIQIYLDSKRDKNPSSIEKKALAAKELIHKLNPDIVITSDDNAAKYLISPYFKNSSIPFVFVAINWTVNEYNFSHNNVTGMIEILPVKTLFKLASSLTKGKKAIFIGDDTITDKKDLKHFLSYAKKNNISLDYSLSSNTNKWKKDYLNAQNNYDFIILGHNSAIKDWNDENMKNFVYEYGKILVLSTYSWMLPFSMIGVTIKANEFGKWAANTAKGILNGYDIKRISFTSNKTWDYYYNNNLLNNANINLPRELKSKAILFKEEYK